MASKAKLAECKKAFTFQTTSETGEDFSQTLTLSSIPINLNNIQSFREFGHQLMIKENIPLVLREIFLRQLKEYVEETLEEYEDDHLGTEAPHPSSSSDQESSSPEKEGLHETKDKFSRFSSVLKAVNLEKRQQNQLSFDSNGFWQQYHRLIHSGFLTEALISLEDSFSRTINDLLKERDAAMNELRDHQLQEMQSMAVDDVNQLNKLSVTHFAELDDCSKIWDIRVKDLKETQRREFREWVDKVSQDLDMKKTLTSREETVPTDTLTDSIEQDLEAMKSIGRIYATHETEGQDPLSSQELDESFTINLGSQLKTTHNIRLLACHALDLLRDSSDPSLPSPQRTQTAMSLYSNHLSGMVLLVDNRANSYSGIKKDFASLVEESTDLHFPCLEEQLANKSSLWKTGDVYITRHSTLSQCHVVFHLVSDESVMSSQVSSRHPILHGLRNLLKTAYLSDVTTLCLPLLLTHDLTEQMTINWCLKRAELVFKSVKGFMIEMASLNDVNRTIKFLLPSGIQEQLFHDIANMIPSIFRLSNPLVLVESSQARNESRNSGITTPNPSSTA